MMNSTRISFTGLLLVVSLACPFGLGSFATAGDYYTKVPFLPTVKINTEGEGATPVDAVYGKEYSHTDWMAVQANNGDPNLLNVNDHNAFAGDDPLQVVSWDGLDLVGGDSGSVDAFDYGSGTGFNYPEAQVDALANHADFLLPQVVRNEATLLFSLTSDTGAGVPKARVHYEAPVGPMAPLGEGVWATIEIASGGPGAGVNHHEVSDLDALEVWGPEPPTHRNRNTSVIEGYDGGFPGPNTADANRFSIDNDALNGGVSVWAYDIPTKAISPWILHSEIVAAVEKLFLEPAFGPEARFEDRNAVDVDATMARDVGDASPTAALWDPGDELLFSIDPMIDATVLDPTGGILGAITIDGGEVMHLVKVAPGLGKPTLDIKFLDHGGHLWDTAFPVAATFGYDFEDVDALEAVGVLEGTDIATPEPSSLVLAGLALVLVGYRLRRNELKYRN